MQSNMADEPGLIARLVAGDRAAGRAFLEQYGGLIRHAVLSVRVRSDSMEHDDVFHGAIGHLLAEGGKVFRAFQGRCSLSSYLYTVCRRYALSVAVRENRMTSQTDTGDQAGELPDGVIEEDDQFDNAQRTALDMAIKALDEEGRLFVRMVLIDKRPTEEVMRFFGLTSENSVYSRKNKLVARLRKTARQLIARGAVSHVT